ncbi:hypothetical protein [Cohnella sp. JJ-181]|uniref:hypothetical protein n=1 Tax=Cohnella rhizoplanae TaxID=2974897 RepID=UPI0022FF4EF6|nr:hypothetical protein [Cohnella sp. JJ-181]CAI6072792.1 hypothetical protein COHCIP112018_02360 [Cohnella sp. JJ-181]
METQIQIVHAMLKEMFPEAVAVNVFVNVEGIRVEPQYRTNLCGLSMRMINGKWTEKAK